MMDGELVSRHSQIILNNLTQVLLVVGGLTDGGYTDTTEVFSGGQWSTVGPLPAAVSALAGVTIDNTVYMTGLCRKM